MRRAAIAVFGALAFSAAPAHADTFNVNTNQDAAPGCPAICSLRGALNAALINGAQEDDVINVPAGTYEQPEMTLNGAVATRITIVGAGANLTFIQPVTPATTRVFNFTGGSRMTLRGMTVRGGRPSSGIGGNIAVSASTLTLDGVRVTDGRTAAGGGGIGAQGAGSQAVLNITRSLIDNNASTSSVSGGGIWMPTSTQGVVATITDSTIAYNTTIGGGGGIALTHTVAPTLNGVTLAFNTASAGAGGIQSNGAGASIQGSIFAGNVGSNNQRENCGFVGAVTDRGGNVDDDPGIARCGLTNPASRRNTNPLLATTFDGSQPPALALPENSPAVDLADCDGRDFDQRAVPRPLGLGCDAGAYEFDPRPETDVIGIAPPFTFSSPGGGATYECSLDGAPFVACATPYDPGAGPGTHTLAVRAVRSGNRDGSPATVTFTVAQPPVTPTPTPTATPTATPVVDRTIVVDEDRGTVKVKVPGSNRYVDLNEIRGIPVGSTVDTRKGRVRLTSIPKAGAPPETAVFYDGIFKVTQSRGITDLKLTEALAKCPKKGRAAAAAKKAKKRKLWGDGKGSFRTTGRYSAATVRGTKWLVEDSCSGTLTRVTQGSVTVKAGKVTKVVRAGKRYLARPR